MRQVVLDTETTGLEVSQDHRIIEIGCVEVVNRRLTGNHFHVYINPERAVDDGAFQVHGLDNAFLDDKPLFAQIADQFLAFIDGAQLIIHNAPFDVEFINHEFSKLTGFKTIADHCTVFDSLVYARQKHPGQRNSLDALCKRYGVDNSQRELHGALLDAEILADVYLYMTGGQVSLNIGSDGENDITTQRASQIRRLPDDRPALRVIAANDEELAAHQQKLQVINKTSGGNCVWLKQTENESSD